MGDVAARIISADFHVSVQHDDVEAHQGGNEIRHASWNRAGDADPHERLRDIDVDGG